MKREEQESFFNLQPLLFETSFRSSMYMDSAEKRKTALTFQINLIHYVTDSYLSVNRWFQEAEMTPSFKLLPT